jgi:hypothetical protein
VGQRSGIGDVVDRNEIKIALTHRTSKQVSANAAESINSYFDGHRIPPLSLCRLNVKYKKDTRASKFVPN